MTKTRTINIMPVAENNAYTCAAVTKLEHILVTFRRMTVRLSLFFSIEAIAADYFTNTNDVYYNIQQTFDRTRFRMYR